MCVHEWKRVCMCMCVCVCVCVCVHVCISIGRELTCAHIVLYKQVRIDFMVYTHQMYERFEG